MEKVAYSVDIIIDRFLRVSSYFVEQPADVLSLSPCTFTLVLFFEVLNHLTTDVLKPPWTDTP